MQNKKINIYSSVERENFLKLHKESGLSQKEFCLKHNIHKATFNTWYRRSKPTLEKHIEKLKEQNKIYSPEKIAKKREIYRKHYQKHREKILERKRNKRNKEQNVEEVLVKTPDTFNFAQTVPGLTEEGIINSLKNEALKIKGEKMKYKDPNALQMISILTYLNTITLICMFIFLMCRLG